MRTFLLFIFKVIILLSLCSCVEEYWPELKEANQNQLVVDGFISNEPGPYTIKLSKTRSLDSIPSSLSMKYDFNPFKNATVIISDDLNNSETLKEIEPGIYQTAIDGIQGVVGRSYKVTIIAQNGKSYESDFEEIKNPVGIKSVECEYTSNEFEEEGIEFSVTSEVYEGNNNYFRWELEETYEYRSPYTPSHIFNGRFSNSYTDPLTGEFMPGSLSMAYPYNIPPKTGSIDTLVHCWKTNYINTNYIHSTLYSSGNQINDFKLNFIPHKDERIRIKYSLNVKQSLISEIAYKYLEQIEEQNSYEDDELYTKQPYQIRGNIKNTDSPNEAVLGFFYAKSVSKKRAFALPETKPKKDVLHALEVCKHIPSVMYDPKTKVPIDIIGQYLSEATSEDKMIRWPIYCGRAFIYHPKIKDPDDYPIWFVAYTKSCIDCRYRGGISEKPDYWDSN